jgi:hypothetical protein
MRRPLRNFGILGSSLAALQLLAGCDDNGVPQGGGVASTGGQTSPPPTLPLPARAHGHVRGAAAIGEPAFRYYVEGLLTVGGEVRLYFGGPGDLSGVYSGAGMPEVALDPNEAMQFVGNLTWDGSAGRGKGVVIGQNCAPPALGGFCAIEAPAVISVSGSGSSLRGEIRVDTGQDAGSWEIDLSYWSIYYSLSAAPGYPGGLFSEQLAPFDEPDAVVISIDAGGRLFFQSPSSGCTGNGMLTPNADGRVYVFDVELIMENCRASYSYLNRAFEGLATETQDNAWGYDNWLVMLLSTPEGPVPRLALTMISSAR